MLPEDIDNIVNDKEQQIAFLRLVLFGMDDAIGMLARIQSTSDYEGKPAASLAAGWISGWALTEKERLRRIIDEADSQ